MTRRHPAFMTLSLLLVAAAACPVMAQHTSRSLAGQWRFQLDPDDAGLSQRWYARALPDSISLPGVLAAQGIGEPVSVDTEWTGGIVDKSWFTAPEYAPYRQPGNIKIPFWLQPERHYQGAAWFQRDIDIPAAWRGRRVVLFLERAHWETRVWLDTRSCGTNDALATPHCYDLGRVQPGKHTLTIRVDNRMIVDVGENSHSISDHTQGNWNGLVGRLELQATAATWIADLQAYPQVAEKSVIVRGQLGTLTGAPEGTVELRVRPAGAAGPEQRTRAVARADGTFTATLALGADAPLWDEFQPALFELTATAPAGADTASSRTVRFGLREIATRGTQFTINGRRLFFRGTLECAIFPKTGHPPTDVDEWKRIIRVCKAHGLNMMRFHSWCPPEAAFTAADQLGFYLHVECSSWANQSTTLGDGKPVDKWIYAEADRILKFYGNHPSFVLLMYGNEPGGPRHKAYLSRWVEHYRARDPRRLVSGGAGWPELPENQFHVLPAPRIQGWGQGLDSRINARPPETTTDYRQYIQQRAVPIISHEIGQWCVYPNFDEMPKYTGYLKPKNFEIFRDRLAANGMSHLARPFLLASGKLQALCYKEDIESALRTPGMGGFQLLDLHDFPGQGTALVGVLDPFWEEKGYIAPAQYRRFCNRTVPLARLPKRVFTCDETLRAEIEVAHFGPAAVRDAAAEWELVGHGGDVLKRGKLPSRSLPLDNAIGLGSLSIPLTDVAAPARCKLVVRLPDVDIENDWDIWVYPARAAEEPVDAVLVRSRFDEAARHHLRAGGKLLLTIPGNRVRNFDQAPVKLGFSSIFWNTAWTRRQAPTTLGILCDPEHPALARFPTESHSNWQWWYILHRAGALRLDLLPPRTDPVVRVIDDWFTARPLALIVEGRCGPGKVVICGFDLTSNAEDPVSRQMRQSLVDYLASDRCQPPNALSAAQIQSLYKQPNPAALEDVRHVSASSHQRGYEPENAVDGDPQTIWHTAWDNGLPDFPHELVVEFARPRPIQRLVAVPRQDGNRNGWIKGYEVYGSLDGQSWGEPLAQGELDATPSPKTIPLAAPVDVRFLRLRVLSGHADGPWASLAELRCAAADAAAP